MRLGLASDHRGFTLKEQIKETLKDKYNEIEIIDYGTDNTESTDYPDYAFKLGEAVANNKVDFGVAICRTGIGISIACNKVKGIRCAKVDSVEDAVATRNDNDAKPKVYKVITTEIYHLFLLMNNNFQTFHPYLQC